jgi:SAM-dependent methyltransferase
MGAGRELDSATWEGEREAGSREAAFQLFLVGFLVLFLELACIRWFGAYVIFLQFFTNVVLIACFLGMSCGCLAARSKRDWLAVFPLLGVLTFLAALLSLEAYLHWSRRVAVDVGSQVSPQVVFFGTEPHYADMAHFVVPIEFIAAVFFVLVALLFVGLGQVLGRAFDAYPKRVLGYTLNIGGSLAGIVAFSAASLAQTPPVVWFLFALAGVAYLLRQRGKLNWSRGALLAALVVLTAVPPINIFKEGREVRWSPYYAVTRDDRLITVNNIGHQLMMPFAEGGSRYSLIHLLQEHAGGKPFKDVLVIGAGSGNDVAHALRFDADRVDAVEIDPVILDIGVRLHPDRPYQDPRVVRHLDDGRHFLRATDRKYDLVVYALVDSLILHSSYSSIRLESFLFTEQAFDDIRRVLKPGGIFVTYNNFRQGWIVHRIAAMAEKAFGEKPIVISLPSRETLGPHDSAGFTMLVVGDTERISEAFARRKGFWLNQAPPKNLEVDGFASNPAKEDPQWSWITPTKLVSQDDRMALASDDWPFLYTLRRTLPMLTFRFMLLLGVLGLGMAYLFKPKGSARGNGRMFFLGAAFMLLETKSVVQLALLFGSTWLVNSLVFFTVLLVLLLANLYVLKRPGVRLGWHYAGLFILLAANMLVPLDVFLTGGIVWRYVIPCALAMGPMYFAGVIFARSFRDSANPDQAFGANIAGSVVGGLSESFSTLLGFRYLLILAMAFYALSALRPKKAAG